ncbi:UNVERIFIED_CONTAM: hypothetical protein GTU68_041778 [Idotea baltica]|nr:hypothetical protein [Idotea baltica]
MTQINNPLEFELPIVELEAKLCQIKDEIAGGDQSKIEDYSKIEKQVVKLKSEIYGKLSPFQRVQLSRHFDRPYTLDYIKYLTTDFIEFHGDKLFKDDPAIVGGTAKMAGFPVMIVGHQRGRTTQERLKRNFGMPQPEGYRKALRLFRMAEKFSLPIITFIDTQGAFPGIEAEERGQAEAIARNIAELSEITVPIISVVIGEGGSGGALALGVSDKILMLENACYSVITPEGCASILWQNAQEYAPVAAELLKLTASNLHELGIIEEIVEEPTGGAHRNHREASENLEAVLIKYLNELSNLSIQEMLDQRYQKYRSIGKFTGE